MQKTNVLSGDLGWWVDASPNDWKFGLAIIRVREIPENSSYWVGGKAEVFRALRHILEPGINGGIKAFDKRGAIILVRVFLGEKVVGIVARQE